MSDAEEAYKKAIDYVAEGYRGNSTAILVEVARRDPILYCAAIDAVIERERIEKAKKEDVL